MRTHKFLFPFETVFSCSLLAIPQDGGGAWRGWSFATTSAPPPERGSPELTMPLTPRGFESRQQIAIFCSEVTITIFISSHLTNNFPVTRAKLNTYDKRSHVCLSVRLFCYDLRRFNRFHEIQLWWIQGTPGKFCDEKQSIIFMGT